MARPPAIVIPPLPSTAAGDEDAPSTPPPCTPPLSGNYPFVPAGLGPGAYGIGLGLGRRGLMRRRSSLCSVSSWGEGGERDDEMDVEGDDGEWTRAEEDEVTKMIDAHLAHYTHFESPFPLTGLPPSNLTHVIAKACLSSSLPSSTSTTTITNNGKWRHNYKTTRAKVIELLRDHPNSPLPLSPEALAVPGLLEATPRASLSRQNSLDHDPEATPRVPSAKKTGGGIKPAPIKMVRQGSMDFLSGKRDMNEVARLGSRLHKPSPPPTRTTFPSRARLNRTHSLSSIAGSPSQPTPPKKTPASTSARAPTFVLSHMSGDSSSSEDEEKVVSRGLDYGIGLGVPKQPVRMARVHSDNGFLHAASTPTSAVSSTIIPAPAKESAPVSGWTLDFEEGPSSFFPSRSFSVGGLGSELGASLNEDKKPKGRGEGLASAFHTPLPSPGLPPVSEKKEKRTREPSSSDADLANGVDAAFGGGASLGSELKQGGRGKRSKTLDLADEIPRGGSLLSPAPAVGRNGAAQPLDFGFVHPDHGLAFPPASNNEGDVDDVDIDIPYLSSSSSVSSFSSVSTSTFSLSNRYPSTKRQHGLKPSSSISSISTRCSHADSDVESTRASPMASEFDHLQIGTDGEGEVEEAKGRKQEGEEFLDENYVRAGRMAEGLRLSGGGWGEGWNWGAK
ncbi:hypothetical protein MNV49_000950 [Pseudohyphozyma bogoriensis]|nr:hypothetical protein MNV49_000950 [Pseudohyphozyma bogoriensis]